MRHVYIRGILTLAWLATAVIMAASGNVETAALYAIIGGVFLYSAYTAWKKEKTDKGDK